ncbi:MAG TPA: DNA-binding protein [Phycisphaerae bacterium]|nr:DNA-binding protein [Phycisphaerae bacterium]
MRSKLYIETTIPSYLVARPSRDLIVAGHQQLTLDWWDTRSSDFDLFVSQFVIDEASLGDPEMIKKRLGVINSLDQLEIVDEVGVLAEKIVIAGAIPEKASTDAAHIAVAAVHAVDYLLTWNCTHIANAEILKVVRRICETEGFACPIICTPEELMGDDNNEE